MARLPSTYKEVEYLQSSGTQHINTGITSTNVSQLKIQTILKIDEWKSVVNSGAGIVGCINRGASTLANDILGCHVNPDSVEHSIYAYCYTTSSTALERFNNLSLNTEYNVAIEYKNNVSTFTLNGTTRTYQNTTQTKVITAPIYIFKYNDTNGSLPDGFSGKIYSCVITINNVVVGDFVPCYRVSDGEAGLYNLSTNEFLTNQGTGYFIVGPDIKEKIFKPLFVGRVRFSSESRLPNGYTEVEYVGCPESYVPSSAVSAYTVLTDVKPTATTGFKCRIGQIKRQYEDFNLIGCRSSDERFMINGNGSSDNDFYLGYGYGQYGGYKMHKITTTDTYDIQLNYKNNRKFIVDDTEYNMTTNYSEPNDTYFTFFTQAVAPQNYNTETFIYNIYGDFIFTENQTEIRRYVPCVRNSDGIAGFYELYTDTFITSSFTSTKKLVAGSTTSTKYNQPLMVYRVKIDPNASRLPSGYTEKEYIETDATHNEAYIDTGLSMPDGFKSESKFRIIRNDTTLVRYMGAHNAAAPYNRNHHSLQPTTGNSICFEPANGGTGYFMSTQYVTRNVDYVYEVDNTVSGTPIAKANGASLNLTLTGGTTGTRTSFNIYYLSVNQGGVPYWSDGIRSYYLKIWDKDNTLLRDYVPCVRDSDSKTGMFDLAHNVFYPAQGTTEFVVGNSVGAKVIKPLFTSRVVETKLPHNLPSAYQEVEWIGSTGTQYIDTGLSAPNGFRAVGKIEFTTAAPSSGINIIGTSTFSGGYSNRNFIVSDTSTNGWCSGFGGTGYQYYGVSSEVGKIETFDICNIHNEEKCVINNKNYAISITGSKGTFYSGNLTMFAMKTSSEMRNYGSYRVYYMRVYTGGSLKGNYIPCYRKSDNVIGLYDLVTNTFLINQGSGTFTKGNNI